MSKVFKIRDEEESIISDATIKMIVETKVHIKENDLLHALIRKEMKNLTAKEVLKYREEMLGKND